MFLGIAASDLPLVLWYVLSLVLLEGLLSADNALVLAVLVRHLPNAQRKKALRYGLWGAFIFRLIAVLLSTVLMRFWAFKVLGGLYLIYLCAAHFFTSHAALNDDSAVSKFGAIKNWRRSFWGTVVSVELADVAFSIDSILAAVGMAESLPARYGDNWKLFIVYLGGVLGIITMRFVAGYFIILLERFGGLAEAAYLLVGWIGLKLILSGLHSGEYLQTEIPAWVFWSVMVGIAFIGFFIPRTQDPESARSAREVQLLDPLGVDSDSEDQAELLDRGSRRGEM